MLRGEYRLTADEHGEYMRQLQDGYRNMDERLNQYERGTIDKLVEFERRLQELEWKLSND